MRELPPWSTRHICACGQNDTFAWPAPNLIAGWRTISRLSDVNFWPEPRPFKPSSRRGSSHSPAKATRGRNRTGPAAGRWRSLSWPSYLHPRRRDPPPLQARDPEPMRDPITTATRPRRRGETCSAPSATPRLCCAAHFPPLPSAAWSAGARRSTSWRCEPDIRSRNS